MRQTLKELVGSSVLQEIQSGFAKFIGVAAQLTDENGAPLIEGSSFSDFCSKYVRSSDTGRARCEECRRNGAKKAISSGKAEIYSCHAGLVDFAAPIMVGDAMVGCFCGGQVRIDDMDEDKLRELAGELGLDPDAFVREYFRVAKVDQSVVDRAAEFLSLIAQILSKTAYQNYLTIEEMRKKEEYAIYQSDYFMRINEYMKQQFMSILEETMPATRHENLEVLENTLDNVIKKTSNVLSVVDHMVEYLSLTGGDMGISEDNYQPRELLRPMQDMAFNMQNFNLSFDIVIDDSVPGILFGDSMRISYIISRLMDYRFTYTTSGWIILKLWAQKRSYATMLMIELSDTGERIAQELVDRILDFSKNGNLLDMDYSDDLNTSVGVIGLLVYQLSGKISINYDESGSNVINIEIPQLTVFEEN